MEKLFFFDETFYWGRSGRRATVIEAECELTQSVRPDELRAAVNRNASSSELEKIAVAHGMITLRQDGEAKVAAGITTAEELSRSAAEM